MDYSRQACSSHCNLDLFENRETAMLSTDQLKRPLVGFDVVGLVYLVGFDGS